MNKIEVKVKTPSMLQEKPEKSIPNIFCYFDFRKYLDDFRLMKEYTHEYCCVRLGQKNSRTYFADVIKGRKTVSDEFVNRFIELLELDDKAAVFFRTLVNYNQTSNVRAKESFLRQLTHQCAVQSKVISEDEYAYYEVWYHSVIRAVLDIVDFKDDYKTLTEMINPRVTIAQAKQSIQLLLSLELIAPDERGFLRPKHKSVKTEDYINTGLVRQYQLQCLEMAKLACMSQDKTLDDISTNIMSISENGLKEVQKRLNEFRSEVRAIVNNDKEPADRVYQLDIQLFANAVKD